MRGYRIKTVGLIFFVLALLFAAGRLWRVNSGGGSDWLRRPFEDIFTVMGRVRSLAVFMKGWKNLAGENESLKKETASLRSAAARLDILENENQFLKRALGMRDAGMRYIEAGMFGIIRNPAGYTALLNKGRNDGVKDGSPIIGDGGILLGSVTSAESGFSRVRLVTDPEFKATVKLLDSQTRGMASGALTKGILLELVTQDDNIRVGETAVTSGDDFFPPALIVGTVAGLVKDDASAFKNAFIKPALESFVFGRVLIIVHP